MTLLPRASTSTSSLGVQRWPPVLATRGEGALSTDHAHHAMHVLLAEQGTISFRRSARERWQRAPGLITAPDVSHSIDSRSATVVLVFIDPESDVGEAVRASFEGPLRPLTRRERAQLLTMSDPVEIMQRGDVWASLLLRTTGASPASPRRAMHPKVRRLLKRLQQQSSETTPSLELLAEELQLSPSRLMHVFTESVGLPLRPYLAWLRLQRAASLLVGGTSLSAAAHTAGFSDAAHMSRTFRRMLGASPSELAGRGR